LRFKFGLSSTACRLFGSFLGPRTQKVMIGVDISIGSPQGSDISPILFACFIDDVGDHGRNLYADDLQIYTVDGYGDVNRLVALVNGELKRILDWSRDNFLILNASKTQALLFSRRIQPEDVGSDVILGGDSVRLSDVVKNLGLYVDVQSVSQKKPYLVE
jgi:hypothetical protein